MKRIKKLVWACAFALFLSIGIAYAVGENDCSTRTAFWGTRCCVYTVEDDPYVPYFVQKCCDYRVLINIGCDETAF
jgi:hypothetical protein